MKKTLLLIIVTLFCATNSFAQNKPSQIIFKFEGAEDILSASFAQNKKSLKTALLIIKQNPNLALGSIKIEGYCKSDSLRKNNLKLAATRSNRVKSELITISKNISEKNFTTRNYCSTFAGMKNVVVVTINYKTSPSTDKNTAKTDSKEQTTVRAFDKIPTVNTNSNKSVDIMNNSKTPFKSIERKNTIRKPEHIQKTSPRRASTNKPDSTFETIKHTPQFAPNPLKFIFKDDSDVKEVKQNKTLKIKSSTKTNTTTGARSNSQFYIKANLLKWVTLTPDLGIEWKYNMISVALNGGTTFGRIKLENTKMWGQWYIKPQLKIHLGKNDNWYVGLGYNYGNTNYMYSHDNGQQGTHQTASVIAGYKLPIGKSLSLDFNIGAGFINWNYENYIFNQDRYISTDSGIKQTFGLTDLGVTLMWKFR